MRAHCRTISTSNADDLCARRSLGGQRVLSTKCAFSQAVTNRISCALISASFSLIIRWINARDGKAYRLPTADEWSAISNGLSRRKTKKLFDDPRLAWAADYGAMETVSAKVQPSGSFGSNANGVADLAGNVWEWTSTCATPGADDRDCPAYIAAGLHEAAVSVFIRDPAYGGCALGVPPANIGFRLVED